MRPQSLVALLALLLLPLISADEDVPSLPCDPAPCVGPTVQTIKNTSDPVVIAVANFAVTEYNKRAKKHLVFQRVIKGETLAINGVMYTLFVNVKDESSTTANYVTNVWDQPFAGMIFMNFKIHN